MTAMQDVDLMFTRLLLGEIAKTVRQAGHKVFKDGWVYCYALGHWEFHGPREFYWHGRAANAYDARYKGWSAWLQKHRPELVEGCDAV